MKKRIVFGAILLKGFTSVIAQTLLIRELFIIFNGNELTFGIILSVWLVSGAVGSGLIGNLFKKTKTAIRPYCILQIILSLWLPLSIILIRTAKPLLGVWFAEVFNIHHIVTITILALALLALSDGAMYTVGFRLVSSVTKKGSPVAKIYLLESLGIIAGGISFTFFFLSILNSFEIACLVTCLNLLFCFVLLLDDKNRLVRFGALSVFLASVLLYTQTQTLQKWTLAQQWHKKNIIEYQNSVYGNIAVSEEFNQFTIFYDGLPTISIPSPETYFTEDFIHLPMLTKPEAQNILLVGHAVGGLLTEVLKYPLEKVVYVEIDPLFIKIIQSLQEPTVEEELSDPRVKLQFTDGRSYLKEAREEFDCIFVNSGLPTSLAINRYYTREFFQDAERLLGTKGLLILKTWGSLAYLSDEHKRINALLLKTLLGVFAYCDVIPGDGFNIMIASNQRPQLDTGFMTNNLEQLGLKTLLISEDYLKLRLQKQYIEWFNDNIKDELKTSQINEDLKPTGLYEGLGLYYSQFSKKIPELFSGFKKVKFSYLAWGLLAFLALWRLLLLVRPRTMKTATLNFTVLSTGFFAMSLQVVVLFLFQSLLGYLFHWLAILTTSFMAGASFGAYYANRRLKEFSEFKKLAFLEAFLPTLSIILIAGILYIFNTAVNPYVLLKWLFSLTCLTGGLLAGIQMPLVYALYAKTKTGSSEFRSSQTAGRLYCLDLIGACFGAIITPLILIPGCGILATAFILCLLKIGNGWNISRV